jgi:hypothetical protein
MTNRAHVEKYASMTLEQFIAAMQELNEMGRSVYAPAHAAVKNMAKSWLEKDDDFRSLKGKNYQLGIQKDQCLERERKCLAQTNNNWLRGIGPSRVLAPQSPRKKPRSSGASRGS